MKILVTGGAGFIGLHLCTALLQKGFSVTVLDDLSNSKAPKLKGINLVRGDVRDKNLVDNLVKENDLIYHLAATSRVIPAIKDPLTAFDVNVNGTVNVAVSCSKHQKHLVFTSSREVYGNPDELPCAETAHYSPVNPYGASKIAGECIIKGLQASNPFSYSIFRLANVYGPGDKERVLPTFIQNAIKGKDLTVFGHDKTIDFVHVDDVVEAFLMPLKAPTMTEVNVGSGRGISLEKVAEYVIDSTKSKSSILHKQKLDGEVDHFVADISAAKKLNWMPKVTFNEGINRLVKK
ncbi:MAG: NAD-dependent epimerase/dehydratase family protein [Candidatus Micrarchaeia archaeon]